MMIIITVIKMVMKTISIMAINMTGRRDRRPDTNNQNNNDGDGGGDDDVDDNDSDDDDDYYDYLCA